jgi:hypothetical protein
VNVENTGGDHETGAEARAGDRERHGKADTVDHAAHGEAADAEADHDEGIGQGGFGTRDAEIRLDRRKHHGDRVHARRAHGHDQQGDKQAKRGIARVGLGVKWLSNCMVRSSVVTLGNAIRGAIRTCVRKRASRAVADP